MDGKPSSTEFDRLVQEEVQRAASGSQNLTSEWQEIQRRLEALRSELLPTQLAMLVDPAKNKAAICTRRSGKTYYNRHEAAEKVAANPWANRRKAQPVVQYIAQTQKKALDLFWTPFKQLCERVGMDAHWDDANLRAQFTNGVLVRASGVDTGFDIEKYRGDAYVHVIIDEAASYGPKVEKLVVEGLGMAMADYDGSTAMTGTPGPVEVGYFYEVYKGLHPNWSVQPCWTFMDNPHLPANTRTWEWVQERLGPLDSPKVRREAFGEWVTDSSTLVYQYDDARNGWDGDLPTGHEWRFLLGMDLGFRDPTAFVIGAYARTHPWLFVVSAEESTHLLPSAIESRVQALNDRYHFSRIVVDTGGSMARSVMEEWNRRSKFGMLPADKKPGYKYTAIEHFNSEMHMGRIKIHRTNCAGYIKQLRTLPWDDGEAEAERKSIRHDGKQKEHGGFPNHSCDAGLYMFLESRHYKSKEPEPEPTPGTPDYWAKQQLRAKHAAIAKARSKGFQYGKLRN